MAMQKDIISVFLCFSSFVLRLIPYIFRIYGISRHNRFGIISQNMTKLTNEQKNFTLILQRCGVESSTISSEKISRHQ